MPPHELETLWSGIREDLRRSVTDLTFHLWLEPLELAGRDRDLLHVRAPRHIRTLVEERYLPLLRAAGERVLGQRVAVSVVEEGWRPTGSRGGGHSPSVGDDDSPSAGAGPNPSSGSWGGGVEVLNPKYTFEQFVIGEGNRLGHAAALAVAEQPGQAYNPLFLHGPPGLGKTHLLHAIGNYVRRFGGVTVRYATSEDFTSGFVRAVRGNGIEAFKTAFRDVDVLLLDDVQFLAQRSRTQEELFHTFNALYESGCQLVLSSDRAPGHMDAFERRLAERFAAGLVAELEPPALDVQVAILKKRVTLDGLVGIDEETLRVVAEHGSASVRSLEGALIRVVAYASLRDQTPSPELARQVLSRLYPRHSQKPCTLQEIQRATAAAFHVDAEAMLAHDRRSGITFPRQVAMYLARELTDESLLSIGAGFGGRNHSTILHAHRKVATTLERDPDTAGKVRELRLQLSSSRADRQE